MTSSAPSSIDLNDLWTRSIYTQLVVFKAEIFQGDWTIEYLSPIQQRILQTLAHELDLEYEYYLSVRTARISRPETSIMELFPSSTVTQNLTELTTIPMGIDMSLINEPRLLEIAQPYGEPLDFTPDVPEDVSMEDRQHPPGLSNPLSSQVIEARTNEVISNVPNETLYCWEHGCNGRQFRTLNEIRLHKSEMCGRSQGYRTQKKRRRYSFNSQVSTEDISPATTPLYDEQRTPSTSNIPQVNHGRPSFPGSESPWALESPNSPQRALSRASSAASSRSQRGRTRARPSSLQSRASSGHRQFIFDADPTRSSSNVSAASGRRGPLDRIAKAGMNALKNLGACWRCKVLRKSCNPETPCPACPKRNQDSQWRSVGCRRGQLQTVMRPIILCPTGHSGSCALVDSVVQPSFPSPETSPQIGNEAVEQAEYVASNLDPATLIPRALVSSIDEAQENQNLTLSNTTTVAETSASSFSTISMPLNECIFNINHLFTQSPWKMGFVPSLSSFYDGDINNVMELLKAAATYQAVRQTNRLIAQSLICLRAGLEVFGNLSRDPNTNKHLYCHHKMDCEIIGVSELKIELATYIKELSRVFFKKENLRGTDWWLSAIYSLCIQGSVRKVLCSINTAGDLPGPMKNPVKQYLHLAIRLFIARSGAYDPLVTDWDTRENHTDPSASHFKSAQNHLNTSSWRSQGISSTADFLQCLFEDNGEFLETNETIEQPKRDPSLNRSSSISLPPLHHSSSNPPPPPRESIFSPPILPAYDGPTVLQPQSAGIIPKNNLKWTDEEDEEIVALWHAGMSWEDISMRLQGRSAISCCLRYSSHLAERPTWDEKRKNKLAALYSRFKKEIWQKVGDEMGEPWRSVEIHASKLGLQEINDRSSNLVLQQKAEYDAPIGPDTSVPNSYQSLTRTGGSSITSRSSYVYSLAHTSDTIDAVSSPLVADAQSNNQVSNIPSPVSTPTIPSTLLQRRSRQKESRGIQACARCRRRKIRCIDMGSCQSCRVAGLECYFEFT